MLIRKILLREVCMQIASLFVVNLQTHVSWAWGYAVPTMAFGLALSLFLAGTRLYRFVPPGGSALTRMGQVCLCSCIPIQGIVVYLYYGNNSGYGSILDM